jgi:hypothetical protein
MSFCARPSAAGKPTTTNFPIFPSVYHLLHVIVSYATLSYVFPNRQPSVYCVEHISVLPVAFRGGGSWSNAARQVGDVPIAICEVFHPKSHTAGSHARISTDMAKSIKNICSRNILLYEKLNHSPLAKRYIHSLLSQ